MNFLSPLRYPGGKAKMAPFMASLIEAQPKRPRLYAEPFAGGAGAALEMLSSKRVERIALNDLNAGIASFWRATFFETRRLAAAIERIDVTLKEWHRQREVYLDRRSSSFELGLSTFFLNRTNRSGILGGRPIGGLEQVGQWKLDARFNKADLLARIKHCGSMRERVDVSRLDGREFIATLDQQGPGTIFYVDPPYLKQGEELYLAAMTYSDHRDLARRLTKTRSAWVLTYDWDSRVPDELYRDSACATFSVSHTAATQHIGKEYLVVPPHVVVNSLAGFGPRVGAWVTGRDPASMSAKSIEAPAAH